MHREEVTKTQSLTKGAGWSCSAWNQRSMLTVFIFLFSDKYFFTDTHVSAYYVSLLCSLKATFPNLIISVASVIHSFWVGVFKEVRLFLITFFVTTHNKRKTFVLSEHTLLKLCKLWCEWNGFISVDHSLLCHTKPKLILLLPNNRRSSFSSTTFYTFTVIPFAHFV